MKIDLYSDVACPWCYIGERRLEKVIAERPDLQIERHWRPFQLRPEMPQEGIPWDKFVDEKFGGKERARAIFSRVSAAGAPDGIEYNWDNVVSAPNTVDAHRLILFAAEQGREWEAVDALYAAHFTEGRNISDRDELVKIAEQAGLDPNEARDYLHSDRNMEEVNASQEEAQSIGVTGVPFFVFDDTYALSGAQPLEVFLQVIDQLSHQEVA